MIINHLLCDCLLYLISTVNTVRFDVNNPENNIYQQMSHLMPPIGGANVDGTIQNITQYHKRNLNDWNFAEHFERDVFPQVCIIYYKLYI